jgi:hypothetical protein
MSVTTTYAGAAQESTDTTRRFESELRAAGERPAIDEFVARVLGQAHQEAYARAAPDEARVILELAQLFADELAKTDLRFDRLRFIEAATEEAA